jgi:hypothetical protein
MPDQDRFAELVEAALAFDRLTLSPDCLRANVGFVARLPGEDRPVFVSFVTGEMEGEGINLAAVRGDYAFHDLLQIHRRLEADRDTIDAATIISFAVTLLELVPEQMRDQLRRALPSAGLRDRVPLILGKAPGRAPAGPSPDDVRLLLYLANGVIASHQRGTLACRPLEPGRPLPTLTLSGEPGAPEIAWALEVHDLIPRRVPAFLPPDLAKLRQLKKLNTIWYVGYWMMPAMVEDDDRTIHTLAVLEEPNYHCLALHALTGRNLAEAAAMLFTVFTGGNDVGLKGIPKKIVFENKSLHDTVAPALATLDASCRLEPDHAILRGFHQDLTEHLDGVLAAPGAPEELQPLEPGFIPADDDDEGWAKVALHLTQRIARALVELKNPPERALVRFFGDGDAAEYHLFETEEITGISAFSEWYCFQYRAKKNSKTVIDKMLAEDLHPALRRLIQARQPGRFSIFMIERVGPGDEVEVRDILAGPVLTVHDPALAALATTEDAIPLKIYPAGRLNFCALAGPFLPSVIVAEAVDYLNAQGFNDAAPDPDRSELLGLLFNWLDPADVPDDDDDDDEDGEAFSAVYEVTKKAAVKKALRQRDDIEYDDEYDDYLWLPPEKPWLAEPEEIEPLGAIWFEDDELWLEVDNPEDLDRGRAWLDQVPGLTFLRTESDPGEDGEDGEDDEPMPPPDPAELAAAQAEADQYYMEWLDERLPAFGNRSPRELCADPRGRRTITILIRSIPPPPEAPYLRIPRDAMLRKLGLEGNEAADRG